MGGNFVVVNHPAASVAVCGGNGHLGPVKRHSLHTAHLSLGYRLDRRQGDFLKGDLHRKLLFLVGHLPQSHWAGLLYVKFIEHFQDDVHFLLRSIVIDGPNLKVTEVRRLTDGASRNIGFFHPLQSYTFCQENTLLFMKLS